MKSQNKRLRNYLEAGYRVNPRLARDTLSIERLAARINDLKDLIPIQKGWIKVKNKFGESCRVREYWL